MARWIKQVLMVNEFAQIDLGDVDVWVGASDEVSGAAQFKPTCRDEANAMAISLRLAAKRLEDIGKGMK